MNHLKTASILVFTVLLLCFASVQANAQQTVTVQPKKPAAGDTVTVTYHPDNPKAAIQSPDSLKLVFSASPVYAGLPGTLNMKKSSDGWIAKIPLTKWSKFASFYFKTGEKTDKNKDNHQYKFFVYKDGKPVKNAYFYEAKTLEKRYPEASKTKRSEMAAGIILKETALHPDNFTAQMALYGYQLKQPFVDSTAILANAHQRIHQKLKGNPRSEEVMSKIRRAYRMIGEKAKGDSVKQAMIKKYPRSDLAMYYLFQQAMNKKDEDEQAQMLNKYINAEYEQSYMNKYYTSLAYGKLFKYYAKHDSINQLRHMAGLWLKPNPRMMENPKKANDYNDAAAYLAKNSLQLEWAMKLAQKAMQLSKDEPVSYGYGITKYGIKPTYLPEDKSKKRRNYRKAKILATMGLIYAKQANYAKAEDTLQKAVKLSTNSDDAQKYLAELYKQTNRPKKTFGIYRDMLMKKPLDKDLKEKLKKSYIAYNGSKKGFKKQTKAIQQQWHSKMIKKFKEELLNKDAPSLAHAATFEGTPLDTTKLEGKVVVLDFWATWCGPCNRAFPHMQKVYEQFKDNPKVQFVILDCGWNDSVKKAKKWQKKHDYTFPLYFDHDSKITTAFEVRGVPTTFVLGQNGRIQFKEIGYSGPAMEKTLPMKINMVLNDNDNVASTEGS